ncbi:hypothetical protein LAZ67_2000978 [Cordylochernes scorpioides]|uniref:Protein kinase domain-containing protein n=1 Tax=Cordylochernes scorpioides TaxID=51811 RepID=A0ABY6K159_9ARAC|nr:hypothetical protein LAZ67_2000978 [Cordylochernes scorpioides]
MPLVAATTPDFLKALNRRNQDEVSASRRNPKEDSPGLPLKTRTSVLRSLDSIFQSSLFTVTVAARGSRHRTTGQFLTCAASPSCYVEEDFWAGINVDAWRAQSWGEGGRSLKAGGPQNERRGSRMFAKFKPSPPTTLEANPITQYYDLGRPVASAGPELVWKIYDAVRKTDKRAIIMMQFDLHSQGREDVLEFLAPDQNSALKKFLDIAIAHVGDKNSDLGKMLSDFRAECDLERDDIQWDSCSEVLENSPPLTVPRGYYRFDPRLPQLIARVDEEASVFFFEKRLADKLHKPKRKETITEILRFSVRQLDRFKHPKLLTLYHPIEESG